MADRTITDTTLIGDWADQYNLLVGDVGDIDTVTTTASDLVGAVNEIDGEIGTLSSLTTTANSNLVVAVNELDGEIGTLASLTTTANSNLVAAINEVDADLALKASTDSPAFTTAATLDGADLATETYVTTQLGSYATLASPALTGNPTAPTQTTGDASTKIATTQFVQSSVASLGGGDVLKVGTPADNQIAVWTGDGTIEGDSGLTWTTATSTLAIGGNKVWNAGNDGAASGLDADLLDGQHGSHYLDFDNFTNLPDPAITLGGDATGSITLTNLVGGTLTVTIVDDSHNHVIGNVDGLQTALDDKADLASPALTGNPTATTQTTGNDSTRIATTAFVQQELDAQVHDAADITTGTLSADRIPSLAASKITSGTFAVARIPSLSTSKITTGTFANARIAESNVTQHQAALSITESQISDLADYGVITSGTSAPSSTPGAVGDVFVDTAGDVVYVASGNASSADWIQVSGSGGVGDLGDTTISGGLTAGDFLRYDGGAWVDTHLIASDIPSLAASKITSGTLADARISESSVTQHEAALSIAPSQLSGNIALGTGTSGNYVATVSGTTNEIEVTGGSGEGTAITVGLPNDVTIGNDLTVTGDITGETIQARTVASTNTSSTLGAGDENSVVIATGTITVPSATFTARDVIIITAGSSNRTINRGSGLAMYLNGTDESSVTLAANGMMSVVFETASKCIISGNFV